MMPGWKAKDERQYEHIKESSQERGASPKRAKEIAARTVNQTRRQRGETPNKTSQGTGNPNTKLEDRSKQELYNLAQEQNLEGRSRMNKSELIAALRKRQ